MIKRIVITNQKGGVGKTTTALTVAHGLALRGYRVLLVDFDPQGQSATALGLQKEPGVFNLLVNKSSSPNHWIRPTGRERLSIIPGDAETGTAQVVINAQNRPIDAVHLALSSVSGMFDWMVFDTAPSVGGIQERAIWAADMVIIPVATDYLSVDSMNSTLVLLTTLTRNYSWKGQLLGLLPTLYDKVTKESKSAIGHLNKKYPGITLPPIHRATILRDAVAAAKTIWEIDPKSQAARDYEKIINAIVRPL